MSSIRPPETKYKLTVTIRGNTHEEIENELGYVVSGGYLIASDYHRRDSFDSTGGRDRIILEHTNPAMTTEDYAVALDTWFDRAKAERRSATPTQQGDSDGAGR